MQRHCSATAVDQEVAVSGANGFDGGRVKQTPSNERPTWLSRQPIVPCEIHVHKLTSFKAETTSQGKKPAHDPWIFPATHAIRFKWIIIQIRITGKHPDSNS
jgi:hypothetical protein